MQPAGKASRPCTLPLAVTSAHDHARYDARGRIEVVYHYPTTAMGTPELTQIYTWGEDDPRDRLEGLRWVQTPGAVIVADIAYTLDDAGHRTELKHSGLIGERAILYESDHTYRLTRETHHDWDPVLEEIGDLLLEIEYQYDAVGNRTRRRTWEGTERTLVEDTIGAHDDNDRLLTAGIASYTWDDRGRLTGEDDGNGPVTYAWSHDDRLLAVTGGAVDVSYTYDPEQRLIARTDATSTKSFIVDSGFQYAQALVEYTGEIAGTHTVQARHVFGYRLLGEKRGSTTDWAVTDALGSVRGLVASSGGAFTGPWGYEAYGPELADSAGADLTHRFAGERRDAETGLDYLRARWMRPDWGGFLSRDPFEGSRSQPATRQPHAYAQFEPARVRDPSGRAGIGDVGGAGALIGILTRGAYLRLMPFVVSGSPVALEMMMGDAAGPLGVGSLGSKMGRQAVERAGYQVFEIAGDSARHGLDAVAIKIGDALGRLIPIELKGRTGRKLGEKATHLLPKLKDGRRTLSPQWLNREDIVRKNLQPLVESGAITKTQMDNLIAEAARGQVTESLMALTVRGSDGLTATAVYNVTAVPGSPHASAALADEFGVLIAGGGS